jgi:hypothetical protein
MAQKLMKGNKEAGEGLYKLYKSKPEVVEKMGYKMVMGMKEIDSPSTFSSKQSKIMQMAPLGPMLQTKNENGMREVNRDSSTEEKMVQGLLGEQTTTTIDLASDPVTTTITPQSQGSYSDVFDSFKVNDKGQRINPINNNVYDTLDQFIQDAKENPAAPTEVVEKPGETAQKKETEFNPYPFKDTYQPWEMRAAARNIRQVERRKKNAAVKKARQDAKDMFPDDREKRREYIKQQKQLAKKNQRDNVSSGMNDLSSSIASQTEKAKNPNQTDTYQAKPNNSGSDYKNIFSNAAERIGNMNSSLGNTDFNMAMKPMQFRKVAYSGKKPGKSGYKK